MVLGLTGRLDPEDKIGGQPADMDANEKMFQEHLRGKAGSNKAVGTPTPEPKGPLRKKKASSTTPKSGQASPATSPLVEHNYSSPVSGVSGSGTGPPKTTVQPSPSGLPTKAKKKLSLPPPDGGHDGPLGKENRSSPTAARARKPPHPNIEKKNGKGETALHSACIKGLAGKVREYLALGADPNTQDHARLTPLHEACQKGHLEIVQILLEAKALPNVPGRN